MFVYSYAIYSMLKVHTASTYFSFSRLWGKFVYVGYIYNDWLLIVNNYLVM